MAIGDPQIRLAAQRLTLLRNDLHQPHSRPADDTRTEGSISHSPSLVNLGVLEQMEWLRREVAEETQRAQPEAGGVPYGSDVYAWMEEETAGLADQRAQVRAAMVYRHSLQYAVCAGDLIAIRKETCPSCGSWSLMWDALRQRAVCGVTQGKHKCVDDQGRPRTWTLAQLAEKAVEKFADRAAT